MILRGVVFNIRCRAICSLHSRQPSPDLSRSTILAAEPIDRIHLGVGNAIFNDIQLNLLPGLIPFTFLPMRFVLLVLLNLASAVPLAAQHTAPIEAINSTLDQLHNAASRADGSRYFKLFADDAVYIGTDAAERWSLKEFRAFAEPYFAKGTGWTYKPRSRHIVIADIRCRCIAWFDELLDSESYGTSRGTGVLVLKTGSWKISQYALTFPIPNDLAKGMTAEIKLFEIRKSR